MTPQESSLGASVSADTAVMTAASLANPMHTSVACETRLQNLVELRNLSGEPQTATRKQELHAEDLL